MGESRERVQVKASAWRAIVIELGRTQLLPSVLKRLTPATRALVDDPPPSSNWIDFERYEELALATVATNDNATWRSVLRRSTIDGVFPLMRVAVEGFLRLFGGSPATLLSRFDTLTRLASRGIEYRYRPESDSAGMLEVCYPAHHNVNDVHFHGSAGGLEALLELCGHEGTVSDPERVEDGGARHTARLHVRWSPRRDRR